MSQPYYRVRNVGPRLDGEQVVVLQPLPAGLVGPGPRVFVCRAVTDTLGRRRADDGRTERANRWLYADELEPIR